MFLPKSWTAFVLPAVCFAQIATADFFDERLKRLACEKVMSSKTQPAAAPDYRLPSFQSGGYRDTPRDLVEMRSGLSAVQAQVVRAAARLIQAELAVSANHFHETGFMSEDGLDHAGTRLAQAIDHYERLTGFIFPTGLTQLFVHDLIQGGETLRLPISQKSPEALRKSVLEAFDHGRFYGVVTEHDSSSPWAYDLLMYATTVVHHARAAGQLEGNGSLSAQALAIGQREAFSSLPEYLTTLNWRRAIRPQPMPITPANPPLIPQEAIPVYIWSHLTPEQQQELRAPAPISASGFEFLDAKVIMSSRGHTFTRLGPFRELGGAVWRDDESGSIWTQKISTHLSTDSARKLAASLGLSLPTNDESRSTGIETLVFRLGTDFETGRFNALFDWLEPDSRVWLEQDAVYTYHTGSTRAVAWAERDVRFFAEISAPIPEERIRSFVRTQRTQNMVQRPDVGTVFTGSDARYQPRRQPRIIY